MHLSCEEILEAVYRNNPVEVLNEYEAVLSPRGARSWEAEASEPLQGGLVYGPKGLSKAVGKIHSEVRCHTDGCPCYTEELTTDEGEERWA